jgi:RimJ/RimL family protein N-acetyltransferase
VPSSVRLVPLRAADAQELVGLLDEPNLREWLRSEDVEDLRARFEGWEVRRSPDATAHWLNWVVRAREDGRAVGWAQATVGEGPALVAYATLASERGRGFATGALEATIAELRERFGVESFEAHIHPDNVGSERVAAAAGFTVTGRSADGERIWVLPPR